MAGDMEVDPAAIQGFATFLADAKAQLDKVVANFDQPNATEDSFGRHWRSDGVEYVRAFTKLKPDLTALSALLEQIGAQVSAGAKLTVDSDQESMGEFKKIEASGETPSSGSGGI